MRRTGIAGAIVVGLAGAIVITWFALSGFRAAGLPLGFPLDDAWIHVRFAQNLARTGCFAFNPGEPTAGSTSPLWVVLLAGASLLSHEFVLTAISLGIVSYLLLGLGTYFIARRMFDNDGAAVLAATMVLVNVRVVWAALSGMETCLAAWLALAAVDCFAADEANRRATMPQSDSSTPKDSIGRRMNSLAAPVLFGLASLARPEAHLLFALAVFLRIVGSCRRDTPAREFLRIVPFRMIAIYVLVTAPWHLFSLWSSGSLLPNTFRANFRGLATTRYPAGYYTYYARWLFVRDHPWAYWFVPLGILVTIRETLRQARPGSTATRLTGYALTLAQLSTLWVICYPVASRIILPMIRHHARYMIPMTPFHALLSVLGISVLVRPILSWVGSGRGVEAGAAPGTPSEVQPAATNRRWIAAAYTTLVLGIAFSALPGLSKWVEIYGGNVYSINHQHVAMAEWVRDHTPPDAVIAAHDIGALGAISQRRVLDLFGLATPGMIRKASQIIPTLDDASRWYVERLKAGKATLLIGYPEWLGFRAEAPDCFVEVHREVLQQRDISGGLLLVAYRIRADRLAELLSKR